MKKKFIEHSLSILFVALVFVVLSIFLSSDDEKNEQENRKRVKEYSELDIINFEDPFDRALFKDVLNIFYPDKKARNDSLINAILKYRHEQIETTIKQSKITSGISSDKLIKLFFMFIKFFAVYVLVLVLTTYGVQTFATFRFIKMKQKKSSYLLLILRAIKRYPINKKLSDWSSYLYHILSLLLKACIKGLIFIILFSPAYVIAYSFKTRFDTNSILFMIFLGVISNGLLITYVHKFYTFLVSESRKGYVQTAIVKNLYNDYSNSNKYGIPYKAIFRINKYFPGHVFQHIFVNARHQYLSTIKEQASFLITGLIIIEMALNIHNHLCYELLQNVLFKNYSIVLIIIFGIFLVVKATEMITDYLLIGENKKYENR